MAAVSGVLEGSNHHEGWDAIPGSPMIAAGPEGTVHLDPIYRATARQVKARLPGGCPIRIFVAMLADEIRKHGDRPEALELFRR